MTGANTIDALDLHADVSADAVSIHMDGDRGAELIVEGPNPGGEVHNGEVYRATLIGEQDGVRTDVGFFIKADELEELVDDE